MIIKEGKTIVILGASGHGKVVADIAVLCGYEMIRFLDDNPEQTSCMGYAVVGTIEEVKNYPDADMIVAIGDSCTREKIQEELKVKRYSLATLVHPSAVIAQDVSIGEGTVVMANSVINPGSRIGTGCIINTGATVDHDNVIRDYVHVSIGSHLAGTVEIGTRTWIGAGAVVSNNVHICADCMIGVGAVVVNDISEAGTYIGIPAQKVENKNKAGGALQQLLRTALDDKKENHRYDTSAIETASGLFLTDKEAKHICKTSEREVA